MLAELTHADLGNGAGKFTVAQSMGFGDPCDQRQRQAEQVVTTEHSCFFAKQAVHAGLAPAQGGIVENIVMDQGCQMQQLHCGSRIDGACRNKASLVGRGG